jgi:hypothetical protein
MDIKENKEKPFSKAYVLRTTAKHMRKSVDVSIRKTFERMAEFEGNAAKCQEILESLSVLHQLRKQLDDFQLQHKDQFTGE